jgi:hypothetical protein
LVPIVRFVELIHEVDDQGNLVGEEDESASEDRILLREALESEGNYNAKVCSSASNSPEEVGILSLRCGDLLAGREDDFDG